MTTTTTTSYAEAVRRALDDLPAAIATDLLEGLEEHLGEVGVDDPSALAELLGPPERYAAELRASAGLPPRTVASVGAPPPTTTAPAAPERASRPWAGVTIGARPLARTACLVVVVGALFGISLASGFVRMPTIATIALGTGAGLAVLLWLGRSAGFAPPWDRRFKMAAGALALAVAATLGASHRRDDRGPFPVDSPFPTVRYPVQPERPIAVPSFVGMRIEDADNLAQELRLVPTSTQAYEPGMVVRAQSVPVGAVLVPGTTIDFIAGAPGPTSPSTTIAPPMAATTPSAGSGGPATTVLPSASSPSTSTGR